MSYIPYGRQDVRQEDIDAVVEVLRSEFLTQGPKVPVFEQAICDYTGAKYATAVNSATSALHIACLALGVKPGDAIWTSPISFVASANCALYCGAEVDFVDIDPETFNMCPRELEKKLMDSERNGTLPSIVIPVHMAGQSCDMAAIKALSRRYNFRIIEDASHAIGGRYGDTAIGNCAFSDICVFSFHPVKIITTAEGGMATTNDSEIASKLSMLRSHGITRDPQRLQKNDGPWYYEQQMLGFNYRMTDLQAALGASQLGRVDEYVRLRHERAEYYDEILPREFVRTPVLGNASYSSLHLYIVRAQTEIGQEGRDRIFKHLRENGVGVNLHYIPIYMQPYYRDYLGFRGRSFPNSDDYYRHAISLPLFPQLTNSQQNLVSQLIAQSASFVSP